MMLICYSRVHERRHRRGRGTRPLHKKLGEDVPPDSRRAHIYFLTTISHIFQTEALEVNADDMRLWLVKDPPARLMMCVPAGCGKAMMRSSPAQPPATRYRRTSAGSATLRSRSCGVCRVASRRHSPTSRRTTAAPTSARPKTTPAPSRRTCS